jgi:LacI family transcriptional regulator
VTSVNEALRSVKPRVSPSGGGTPAAPAERKGNDPERGRDRTTISDVASLAGVSKAAVSYVLNGRFDQVSASTRARIERAVETLGFHPSAAARHLRGKQLRSIGVVARTGLNPAQSALMHGVERTAAARGYNLVLGYVEGEIEPADFVDTLLAGRVDGVLIPFGYAGMTDVAAQVGSRGVPFVACTPAAGPAVGPGGGFVALDNDAGIHALLEHLVALGHRRIAFATHSNAGFHVLQRLDAFRRQTAARGLPVDESLIVTVEHTGGDGAALIAGREAALRLASYAPRPTAIVASLDLVALGVLQGAWQAGWRVPEDLSVVGFDDTPFAAACIPPLTTAHVAWDEIGSTMALALLDRLSGAAPTPHVSVPELVVRQSTARPTGVPSR